MATSLSSLAPATTAAKSLSNLILVSPQSTVGYQPKNKPNADGTTSTADQPPAILFHYEGEQTATIESDITDHFIEDNSAIQDQIALKPEIVTTHGFIGELNDVAPFGLQTLQAAADKLTAIGSYEPALSETALLAYSEAFFLYQTASTAIDAAVSAWDTVAGFGGESVINGQGIVTQSNQSKQQSAFQQFYGYWRSRTLFTVQTPWAIFDNMAIKSLRAIQEAETNVITDFEVTFKMIRTATTAVNFSDSFSFSDRAGAQSANPSNLGTSSPSSSIGLGDGLVQMGVA